MDDMGWENSKRSRKIPRSAEDLGQNKIVKKKEREAEVYVIMRTRQC